MHRFRFQETPNIFSHKILTLNKGQMHSKGTKSMVIHIHEYKKGVNECAF